MSEPLRILLFVPGRTPSVRTLAGDLKSYREALQVADLDFTPVTWDERRYQIVCDDAAVASQLPPNREMQGGRYDGWVIRGPFLVTGIDGDQSVSLDDQDVQILLMHLRRPGARKP